MKAKRLGSACRLVYPPTERTPVPIKNTRELVLRARGHARADHVEQGTYGDSNCNGEVEFKGCAIGCLATPHRKNDLRTFIRALGHESFGEWWFHDDAPRQLRSLKDEFGISPQLARVAEALFESQVSHGAAINFIPRFASALNDGAEIELSELRRAWTAIAGRGARVSTYSARFEGGSIRPSPSDDLDRITDEFLAWLREQR